VFWCDVLFPCDLLLLLLLLLLLPAGVLSGGIDLPPLVFQPDVGMWAVTFTPPNKCSSG